MKVTLSSNLRTNRLLDATISAAIEHFGFSYNHILRVSTAMIKSCPINRRRYGRLATIFEIIVHEIGHVVIDQNRCFGKPFRRSHLKRYPDSVDELKTRGFTIRFFLILNPSSHWRASSRTGGLSNKFGTREEKIKFLKNFSKIPEIHDLSLDVADIVEQRAIVSELTYLTKLINDINKGLE